MNSDVKISESVQPGDIVFECPQCSKSLAIEPRGAGLLITCPDCGTEVQVPVPEADESEEDATVALQYRIAQLERQAAADRARFDEINRELALIQAALDRLVGVMQEVVSPPADEDAGQTEP